MTDLTSRLSTALAGRYEIERHLGEGGMATVYLAQDLKHERKIALKVLKPELAAVLGAERFVQEIKIAARLSHPHILPLFDSGTVGTGDDDMSEDAEHGRGMPRPFLYYAMPYVEGETLRDRLQREKQLTIDDTLRIAKQVASALDYAHRQGVIHRDIKPENILMHEGEAMVADFGIALAVKQAGGNRLTETGLSLGTPQYMSPEQATGDQNIDARSDVYSLGAVVYELLTGDPPFVASSTRAAIAKLLTERPTGIRVIRDSVPERLEAAVLKALAKLPADRFTSAAEFATALEAPAEPSPQTQRKSLVVLPFVNRSRDPENEYFSDGLTEEIITDLSQIRALGVISRNSSMRLKDRTDDTPTIAKELGVSHVVTGSVRRAGDALRVTAELVEAASDTPVWSEKYSGTTADVFGIQEEIARKIVSALEMKLTDTEQRQVAERPIEDTVAYDCYLRARQAMYEWTAASQDRAARLVDEALEIVGENPLLLATKGQICWNYVNVMIRPEERYLDQAAECATRALALDPDNHLGIFVRGLVAGLKGEVENALADLGRARELRPGDANVLTELCRFSNAAGLRDCGDMLDEVLRLDPLTPVSQLVIAYDHIMNGQLQDAVGPSRRVIELAGPMSPLHIYAAWALAGAGLSEEAMEVLERAGTKLPNTAQGSWALFLTYALTGNAEKAAAHATPELTRATGLVDFLASTMADAYALIGRNDDAIMWTRIAVSRGFINYPYLSRHDPFLETVRSDPRFQELMDEVRLRWEALVEQE
ncbi:MAG: protein kinase [Gemmatimonadales bacterium]